MCLKQQHKFTEWDFFACTKNQLLNFRDRAFSTAIYTPTIIVVVQIWCQSLPLDLCLSQSRQKCVSWLTADWGTWLRLQHLVLPNWGDSLLGSLWKLTVKHTQLDLRYLERLSFSPRVKAGPDKTPTLRRCTKLMWSGGLPESCSV